MSTLAGIASVPQPVTPSKNLSMLPSQNRCAARLPSP